MGNLARLSSAKTRSISPENFDGAKGGAAWPRGHRRGLRPRPRPGVEDLALRPHRPGRDAGAGRHRGPRRHPAHLDDAHRPLALQHPARLLGRCRDPSIECPVGDFFACGWNTYAQVSSLAVCVNPGSALQLLLGDALPPLLPHHHDQHRLCRDDALLPDHLRPHRGAGGRRLLSRPVPARQPACPTRRSIPSSTACAARATMWAPTWPGA
jgi:hypothetical protein